MSCHYHVFLGPYLEVRNPIKDSTTKKQSCPKSDCSNHQKLVQENFCAKCGTKIQHIDVPFRGRKKFDIYEKFPEERLTQIRFEGMPKGSEDFMYFKSNIQECGGQTFSEDVEIREISETTPQKEMDEFAKSFTEEILHIEGVFGKENVKIKWGAVSYWS